MSTDATGRLDRRAVARAFDRAASGYDAAATLQRRIRTELLERLQFFRLEPQVVVDLGAGTAQASVALRRLFRSAQVVATDLAPSMLRAGPRPWRPWRRYERLVADAYALPLRSHSVDLVFSNLMLQWCDRPEAVFAEIQRVLRPTGMLLFSTFGPETLWELRFAWAEVDACEHVSGFPDMPDLGGAMMHAGLAEPVIDIERHTLHYADSFALMHELRRIGGVNAALERRRALTGRQRLQAMTAAYEQRREPAGLPATYEIIFGAAFAGRPRGESGSGGEYAVPLAQLGRSRDRRHDQGRAQGQDRGES